MIQICKFLQYLHYFLQQIIVKMYGKQDNQFQNNFKKYVPNSTHSGFSTNSHLMPPLPTNLKRDFQNIMQFQNKRLNQMNHSCSFLQQTISRLQETIIKLQQKSTTLSVTGIISSQSQTITHLKIKQNQFIITELKEKIKKIQLSQNTLQKENMIIQKENQKLKNKITGLQFNSKILNDQLKNLQKLIKQKNQQYQLLKKGNNNLSNSSEKSKRDDKFNNSSQKYKHQYRVLEDKLLELQDEFQTKMTGLTTQCELKSQQIQSLKQQLQNQKKLSQKLQLSSLTLKQQSSDFSQSSGNSGFSSSSSSLINYQNEIKLKQQIEINKELEESYNKLLSTSNKNEIGLHQQLHQLKTQATQQKKNHKKYKKNLVQNLQGLSNYISKKNYSYFSSNEPAEQIEQIKKMFDKVILKIQDQLKNSNSEVQELKKLINQKDQKIRQIQFAQKQLQYQNNQLKSRRPSARKNTAKSSLNGSFGSKNFDNKSEVSSTGNYEQKYKLLIQNLKSDIKTKQNIISDLEKLQFQQFQKSKSKILALQTEISQKKNSIKKLQRQIKQQAEDHKNILTDIESQNQSLKERIQKLQKDKQVVSFSYSERIKSLQQKLRISKQNLKEIQARGQDKVVKYNKLKQKYQKLQLVSNQSQKRKGTQIQELIKKNQTLKVQIKILTQKIHLNQLVQIVPNQIIQNNQNQTPYNKDLVQQIQMQRDRILHDFQQKCKQLKKSKSQYDKIQKQFSKIQTNFKQLQSQHEILKQKYQVCQKKNKEIVILQNQNKILQQQNIDLKNSLEDKKNLEYIHLKSQLEKTSANFKKIQKQNTSQLKKIKNFQEHVQKLNSELKTLKHQIEWHKEKLAKNKLEMQKLKLDQQKQIKNYQRKLGQAAIKQESLVNIINYKNNNQQEGGQVRQSMRGQEQAQMIKNQMKLQLQMQIQTIKQMQATIQLNKQKPKPEMLDQQTNTIQLTSNLEIQSCVNIQLQFQDKDQQFLKEQINLTQRQILNSRQQEQNQKISNNLTTQQVQITKKKQLIFSFNSLQQIKIQPFYQCKQKIVQITQPLTANLIETMEAFTQCDKLLQNQYIFIQYLKPYQQKINYLQLQIQENKKKIRQFEENIEQTQPEIENIRSNFHKQNSKDLKKSFSNNIKVEKSQQVNNIENKKQKSFQNKKQKISNILEDNLLGSFNNSNHTFQQQQEEEMGLNEDMQKNIEILSEQEQNDKFNKIILDKKKSSSQNKIEVNMFQNLNLGVNQDNMNDNFQICEEGQSINVGQTTLNLHIRQIFNKLRLQLQKVFNGEQISMSMMKILPRQLEDDYNEFISYIRQKIEEIKLSNQLSFIMAELGDQPQQAQQIDQQLQNFIQKRVSEDVYTYKKLLQEKQSLITSLINQKTMQENTINQMTFQKEEVQQQNQNRFMNQCNVYKKEIKQLKKHFDQLQMNFMSLKNVFKNVIQIWIDDLQNEDDFRDNLQVYGKIAKLNQKQRTRLNYYVQRYRQIKLEK